MKRILAGAASAVLAGALLLGSAPIPALASTCPIGGAQCITGVPASVNWGAATQGGAERRIVVSTLVQWFSSTPFMPTMGMTNWCRSGTACSASNDIINHTSSMWMAASPKGSLGTESNTQACGSLVSAVFGSATGIGTFFETNPAATGAGVNGIPSVGTALCTSNVAISPVFRFANLNLAVLVPAAKTSGTYTSTLTFGIQ